MSRMTSGTKANNNGSIFEKYVALSFRNKGLLLVEYVDWVKRPTSYSKDVLIDFE